MKPQYTVQLYYQLSFIPVSQYRKHAHKLPKIFQKTLNCNQHLIMESSSQSLKPIYFHKEQHFI